MDKGLGEMAHKHRLESNGGPRPFDVFLNKLALKIKKANLFSTNDYEIGINIDEMANFMRGVFLRGVSDFICERRLG